MAKEKVGNKKAAPKKGRYSGTGMMGGKAIPDRLWENDPGEPKPLSKRDQDANNAMVERFKARR